MVACSTPRAEDAAVPGLASPSADMSFHIGESERSGRGRRAAMTRRRTGAEFHLCLYM